MFPSQTTEPPIPTEEDAFNTIVQFLMQPSSGYGSQYGYDMYLPNAMHRYLDRVFEGTPQQRHVDPQRWYPNISPPFLAAAWDLCRRGIIRPGVSQWGQQSTTDGSSGNGYSITPFGRRWLKEAAGRFDYVPMEPGRFAQMLDKFNPAFGQGFRIRAQEAVRCYGAHAYLACCAMCGAAAESIVLAAATKKDGDKDKVEKQYFASGGRGRIEKKLMDSKTAAFQNEFRGFLSLLKYWRDTSAHGMDTAIQDNEAFTSLAFLLRLAQFATDRWDVLTN